MHDLPVGVRATIIPGKTYEYLAAGPPVLAAVPDGDARDLLAAAGNCYLVRPSDVIGIASALERALENWRAGTAPKRPPAALLAQFERRQLTRQLAQILHGVASG
jgi:glycosyltransferase involved in cell wall biosynthesis